MNLFTLLDANAKRYRDSGAVFLGTAQVATFAELRERALRLATGLRRQGQPGSRVLIVSKNCPEYVELMFAIWAAGMIAVPVNAKLHARELAQIVEDSTPALVFASKSIATELKPSLAGYNDAPECVVIGSGPYASLLSADPAVPVAVAPNDPAWLFFTSGTTGRAKGAILTHRNLMAMTMAHLADFDPVEADGSLVHAAPMSHGSGLYILPYIARGARQIVPASGGYDAAEFIELCSVHPNVAAFLAPTMVQRLRTEVESSGRHPLNLRTIAYGGGPMYVDELRRSLSTLGPVFVQLYGQGEAPMTITGLRRQDHDTDDEGILGSVGWPRAGVEVAVFDGCDQPVPHGEVGEIVCRGDIVMAGYWNNPAATAETLRGGWLHTGDMGSLEADGRLTLRDRSKDVIISGGTNIYPREVEEALLTHPGVAEVSVIGQVDAEWGEIVIAFVVLEQGVTIKDSELDAYCLARIARFKRPKSYIFLQELPKSNYGKVLKRELVSLLPFSTIDRHQERSNA